MNNTFIILMTKSELVVEGDKMSMNNIVHFGAPLQLGRVEWRS